MSHTINKNKVILTLLIAVLIPLDNVSALSVTGQAQSSDATYYHDKWMIQSSYGVGTGNAYSDNLSKMKDSYGLSTGSGNNKMPVGGQTGGGSTAVSGYHDNKVSTGERTSVNNKVSYASVGYNKQPSYATDKYSSVNNKQPSYATDKYSSVNNKVSYAVDGLRDMNNKAEYGSSSGTAVNNKTGYAIDNFPQANSKGYYALEGFNKVAYADSNQSVNNKVPYAQSTNTVDNKVPYAQSTNTVDNKVPYAQSTNTIDNKVPYAVTPTENPPRQTEKISLCQNRPYPRDIDGHWSEIYVRRLYDLCVVEGYEDGNFRPNANVTRAELVKMGLFANGIEPNRGCYDNDCGSPFDDLDPWQGKWVRPAYDRGIVQGYVYDMFRPNQAITRAEAVKVVLATYGYSPTNDTKSFFNDVHGWSVGWVERARLIGLVQGIGNGNFDPNRPITRAEAAKIVAKMIEYWDTSVAKDNANKAN